MVKHFQFEALLRSVLPELHSYALWLCRDQHFAEDLVQEALLRAWKSLHTLRDVGAAKGWLIMIIRREHARYYERQRPEPMDLQAADFPEALLTHRDEAPEIAELRQAIFDLDKDFREPLVLQVLLGYSTTEIAELMELSQGAVLTRLFRARKKLQKRLNTEDQRAQQ